MVKTLGVIGGGVLGRAVARGFMEHAEVMVYDTDTTRRTHYLEDAAKAEIVFICLPTPARPDGTCDTSAIDAFLAEAKSAGWWHADSCYVIRSTVPVGHTRRLADHYGFKLPLLHSPEFLTARCSLTDFQIPARNIIGYPPGGPSDMLRLPDWVAPDTKLRRLYETRFPGAPVIVMTSDESELVKLACNAFFATKVTFFNVIYLTAKLHGCDWGQVREGILSDGRIAHAHTAVPGPSREFGYGGACLQKDVASLRHSLPMGLMPFLLAVEQTNDAIRGCSDSTNKLEKDVRDHVVRERAQIDSLIANAEESSVERTMRNVREAQAIVKKAVVANALERVDKEIMSDRFVRSDETLRLKAQVIRMAHIAAKSLMDGLRPALASGLVKVIEEAGFEFEPPFGGHVKDKIENALQEANRAVANKAVANQL
jgi:hypothetical protein